MTRRLHVPFLLSYCPARGRVDLLDRFASFVGESLRRARGVRGLTLRDVQIRSRGRFPASTVGGYERGERSITLDRFRELAELYGIPPDRLLAIALTEAEPDVRKEVVVDLDRMSLLDESDRAGLAELVTRIQNQRGDHVSDVITLRAGDIEIVASAARIKPRVLLQKLRPALR